MKTLNFQKNGTAICLVLMLLFASCQTEEPNHVSVVEKDSIVTAEAELTDPTARINPSAVFPVTAHLFGKSTADWAEIFGKTVISLDCESVNANGLLPLADKVVAPFGSLGSAPAEYTISKDTYVFLSPLFMFNDYPCPAEFEWEPAEGQSIEDFLEQTAKGIIDPFESVTVIIDGREIESIEKYRQNTGVFIFTGNPELAQCFDPCVTGSPQQGLMDGYFMMLKKLGPGKHTIVVKGELPAEDFQYEDTIIINVSK
ncbi:hypothetical protein [Mariniradius sediminis]|uniref:Uncharacterized protein n=1 Tax=Mariniradius sediminis TaxID=2909237 RepID=A0ABS9BUQ2_9BACT|nr:hypothetical protein [Mariniradius sediminis]MCF1751781.1 hypothetical protein [Mariniradius sediminis]